MKLGKNGKYLMVAALLLAALPWLRSQAQQQDKIQQLMAKKLENSQKVLEGIALNDFEKIAKHSAELIQVSKALEWRVLKTPQYEIHSNDFRRAAETMITQSKAKNLDGAALAYVDLTLSCVRCHKYVREVRMARAD